MNEIIGRVENKKHLNRILKSKNSEFLVVHGRRRVGKTFLISEYFKKEIVFDFTGSYKSSMSTQLSNFYSEYLKRTEGKKETTVPINWSEAFRYLSTYLEDLNKNRKAVVFLDELPWLDNRKSRFVSALEYFWNHDVSKMNHVILVVCGSANSWIQKKLLKSKGGLYNRITHKIKLAPFSLGESELFMQSRGIALTRYQIIELYMVLGGIPHYLKEVEKGKSASQNIDSICFDKNGLLFDEYDKLYHSIFSKAKNHLSIIEALAKRPQGLMRKELVVRSKLPDGGIFNRTLNELIEADFVNIVLPFGRKKKNAIYKLKDMFSLFYFKFMHNKQNGKGSWEKYSKKSSYKAWSGYAFENIYFQHIDQIKNALGLSGIYTSNSSWKHLGDDEFPGTQIDLLIDRDDQNINICEAKFSKEEFVINKSYAAELRKKISIFKNVSKTKKGVFLTLLTTHPAIQNAYYHEIVQSEVSMDALFQA
jgi:AAA+ ATPase superfamily predicted ATPase